MRNHLRTTFLALMVAGLALSMAATTALAQKKTRVTIGVTETMETHNPYGDSVALLYGIYTELTGPLCKYNWKVGKMGAGAGQELEGRGSQHLGLRVGPGLHLQRRQPGDRGRRGALLQTCSDGPPDQTNRFGSPSGQRGHRHRQVHGTGHHQEAHRAAPGLPLRCSHRHQQGDLRQIWRQGSRQEIHVWRRSLQARGVGAGTKNGHRQAPRPPGHGEEPRRARRDRVPGHA